MNLNSMFVFILVALGVFAVLFGFMPTEFLTHHTDYTLPTTTEKEVVSYFSANNITLYTNTWAFDLNVGDPGEYNQLGLPDGEQVEIYFTDGLSWDYIEIYHSYPDFFGLITGRHGIPPTADILAKITDDVQQFLATQGSFPLEALLDIAEGGDSVKLELFCEHIRVSLAILPVNTTISLEDSFNAGSLKFLVSYEIDFDSMKPSAWTLLTQILTFESPDLGIEGDGGTIINYILGIGIWAMFILLIFAAITSVIPTISGWRGG